MVIKQEAGFTSLKDFIMSEHTNKELIARDKELALQTYNRYPVVLSHGSGARLTDVEGREYIDALAGIAVNSIGHCHPRLVAAIQAQASRLMHVSNFFLTEPQLNLSERLTSLSGLERVFFTNSGAEAVETALKIARKYSHNKQKGGGIISMENAFHGRTIATIAAGKEDYRRDFGPMPPGFVQIPLNDAGMLRQTLNKEVAALIIEPLQGEGGINPADRNYLQEARTLCDERDIVLIFDEVQCGIARTGEWFAKDHFGVQPDILCLAKGLGGGFPIGATLINEKVASCMEFGDHGSTFGGNPLACAAAIATLDVIRDEHLVQQAVNKGAWLRRAILELNHPSIRRVKGLGLMLGVELSIPAKAVVLEMLELGVIANATAGNIIRLVPPLVISEEEMGIVVKALGAALKKITNE